ncbi:ribosome maturation factor RimP [Lentisalinibacter sediminis]|uniref:ribosome maturation factor RimP n=1 Tax=Lentisalinibacter sediminis TaxID=2992237 RepID=UPI00386E132D
MFCWGPRRTRDRGRVTEDEIRQLLEPTLATMGYELVDLEARIGGKGLLRLYIDKPEGVSLEDCERVSHQVSGVLDVEDPIPGEYVLEVSSPGLDRPLKRPEHFERFVGSEAKVALRVPLDGRRRFRGTLEGVEDGYVAMRVDGELYRLRIADIDKARLVPEL